MKTIEQAYLQELLHIYNGGNGELEVLRRLNNLLADMLLCIGKENTKLDALKRHIHKQLLTANGTADRKDP